MEYRLPTMDDRQLLDEYVQEHFACGETDITASSELATSDYAEWVERIWRYATVGNRQGERSQLYLCLDEGSLVGLLSVRPDLTEQLAKVIGHIGYGVRPSRRGRGYATAMLRQGLHVCKEMGLRRVILGCYQDNLASAAVIHKSGGILFAENDNYEAGRMSQYFVIEL